MGVDSATGAADGCMAGEDTGGETFASSGFGSMAGAGEAGRVDALTAATRGATAWRSDFDGVRRTTLCAGSSKASPVRGLRMRRSLRIAVSNLQMPGSMNGAKAASRLMITRRASSTARDLTCGMPAVKASSLISRLLE